MEPIQLTAVLAVLVLIASMASVELGVTVALIELSLGEDPREDVDGQRDWWAD